MSEQELNILNDIKAQYPFNVPNGYFENLTARIMDQLPEEDEATAKVVRMQPSVAQKSKERNSRWIKALSIAASVTLLAIVSLKLLPFGTNDSNDLTAQQSTDYDVESLYGEEVNVYSMVENGDIYDYLSGYEE